MPTQKQKKKGKQKKIVKRKRPLLKRHILTPREYKKLRGIQVKKFRERSVQLKNEEFAVDIHKRVQIMVGKGKLKRKRFRFIKITPSEFIPNKYYEIYIRHKPTRQRRILAVGKLREIPIRSKDVEKFDKQLGGRTFNPRFKRVTKDRGNWVPTQKIVASFMKELEDLGSDLRAEVRGAIIPTKRYFHTKWHIFADKPLPGNLYLKHFLVNIVIRLKYEQDNWVGKQSIKLEFTRAKRIKDLNKLESRLESRINNDLQRYHPKAEEISMIEINGFVPIISE